MLYVILKQLTLIIVCFQYTFMLLLYEAVISASVI